jgi:hypothetical protein
MTKNGQQISLVCSLTARFGFAKLGNIRPWSPLLSIFKKPNDRTG